MELFSVILAPENNSGFGNQIYTIAQSIQNCIESGNSSDLILFTPFLKNINTYEFCNLCDVVDIKETNIVLQKINAPQIEDFHLFQLNILKAQIGSNDFFLDVTNAITSFLKDNTFLLPNTFNFTGFCDILVKEVFYKYFIELDKKTFKLAITYKVNNTIINKQYEINNTGFLKDALEIDIRKNKPNYINICTRHDENFYYVKKNIVFNKTFSDVVNEFVNVHLQNNNNNNKINCIHLRLEDDAMDAWSKENNIEKSIYKRIAENKYLREIQNNIKKDDLTIILAHNYDNNVIKYLQDNGYNYITTPIWSNYRDISAIYDCLVGEYCNNIYICLWESSFSYLLGYRIKKMNGNDFHFNVVYYNMISNEELLFLQNDSRKNQEKEFEF